MTVDAIKLTGASNFRSLGGLPAAGGRRIRPHALMRSDRLVALSERDWEVLAGTGITTICDLRSGTERAEHPTTIPSQLAVVQMHCDIRNDLRADPSLARLLVAEPTARGAERVMTEIYRRLPHYMVGTLSAVTDRLLEGGAPLLVHCSAGKDRTGFIVAMLLHALDVPEPVIRADYLASRTWPGAESHRASLEERLAPVVAPEQLRGAVDAVLDVRDVYLDAALETLHAEFGSIRHYIEAAAGLGGRRLERLQECLLA